MKKTLALAALTLTGLGIAAPAHADDDSNYGSGVNAANNWNFSAAAVCFQELAVVPVGGAWAGAEKNLCSTGSVVDHALG